MSVNGLQELGVVVIGRNEGQRLERCLESISSAVAAVVYVDSGSSDASVPLARRLGAAVVELDPRRPFTAARARAEGFEYLETQAPGASFVQFVDGDCQLAPGWLERGVEELRGEARVGAVCGFRREVHPEASIYNRICDMEWRTPPVGQVLAFGGDVMIRSAAIRDAGSYDPDVIAAEDDELSIRMRRRGWILLRIDCPMTFHDADIHHLAQWRRRAFRCGNAVAEVASRHPRAEGGHFGTHVRRTLALGAFLPALVAVSLASTRGLSALLLLLYPLQTLRIARAHRRRGFSRVDSWAWAVSCVASKPVEALGMVRFYLRRAWGGSPRIIEYKGNAT